MMVCYCCNVDIGSVESDKMDATKCISTLIANIVPLTFHKGVPHGCSLDNPTPYHSKMEALHYATLMSHDAQYFLR